LGVFIQKHAWAVSRYAQVSVLHVLQQNQTDTYIVNVTDGMVKEITVSFKPSKWRIINGYRNLKSHIIGWNYAAKSGRPNLLHSHVLYGTCMATWLLHLTKRLPYIYSEHWHGFTDGQFSELPVLKQWLFKITARYACAVTAVSPFLSNAMVTCGLRRRVEVIGNVVCKSDNKAPVSSDKINILSVADLIPLKNIGGIIEAIAKAQTNHPQIVYQIVGDGPQMKMLQQKALTLLPENSFIFYGMLPNDKVLELINASSFIVINSTVETFSVVAAEALLCGKPLVTTRCGGNDFVDNECGILISPANQAELENAIINMTETYKSYMPENLNAKVKNKFTAEVIGKQFFALYNHAIKQI